MSNLVGLKGKAANLWRQNRGFVVFLVLMFVVRSALADWNSVPTGSMKPTIVEGDRIFVNKMAYDLRVPFTHISLVHLGDPERGDIVIFDSKASDTRLVKRIIGVPGDVVSLTDNVLSINGQQLQYEEGAAPSAIVEHAPKQPHELDKTEDLVGIKHSVRFSKYGSRLSNFDAVTVPEGQYLAMGDNRDSSADSRVIGFVPRDEIIGRTRSVVLSFNYDNYYIPRKGRFFHEL